MGSRKKLLYFCLYLIFVGIVGFTVFINSVPYQFRKLIVRVYSCHKIQNNVWRDFCECQAERSYSLGDFDVAKLTFNAIFSLDSEKYVKKFLYDRTYPYCMKYIVKNYSESFCSDGFKNISLEENIKNKK